MNRSIETIKIDFEAVKAIKNVNDRNMKLVALMNELERNYGTFKVDIFGKLPNKEKNRLEDELYSKISSARIF